jgi:hypothetical protein
MVDFSVVCPVPDVPLSMETGVDAGDYFERLNCGPVSIAIGVADADVLEKES